MRLTFCPHWHPHSILSAFHFCQSHYWASSKGWMKSDLHESIFLSFGRHSCNGRILLRLSSWMLSVIAESLGKCDNLREKENKGRKEHCRASLEKSQEPLEQSYIHPPWLPQVFQGSPSNPFTTFPQPSTLRVLPEIQQPLTAQKMSSFRSCPSSINLPISASLLSLRHIPELVVTCPRLILLPQRWSPSPPTPWGLLLHKSTPVFPLSITPPPASSFPSAC